MWSTRSMAIVWLIAISLPRRSAYLGSWPAGKRRPRIAGRRRLTARHNRAILRGGRVPLPVGRAGFKADRTASNSTGSLSPICKTGNRASVAYRIFAKLGRRGHGREPHLLADTPLSRREDPSSHQRNEVATTP